MIIMTCRVAAHVAAQQRPIWPNAGTLIFLRSTDIILPEAQGREKNWADTMIVRKYRSNYLWRGRPARARGRERHGCGEASQRGHLDVQHVVERRDIGLGEARHLEYLMVWIRK